MFLGAFYNTETPYKIKGVSKIIIDMSTLVYIEPVHLPDIYIFLAAISIILFGETLPVILKWFLLLNSQMFTCFYF